MEEHQHAEIFSCRVSIVLRNVLSEEEGAFIELPPLSLGKIESAAAFAVEESESAKGQVLLLGG